MSAESGTLELLADELQYSSDTYGKWALCIAGIRLVGEATNQNGPTMDDWFVCFATGPDMWYEASAYADGCHATLTALGEKLGAELEFTLFWSTDFASNVLWPQHIAGYPMFKFVDVPPKTWSASCLGLSETSKRFPRWLLPSWVPSPDRQGCMECATTLQKQCPQATATADRNECLRQSKPTE